MGAQAAPPSGSCLSDAQDQAAEELGPAFLAAAGSQLDRGKFAHRLRDRGVGLLSETSSRPTEAAFQQPDMLSWPVQPGRNFVTPNPARSSRANWPWAILASVERCALTVEFGFDAARVSFAGAIALLPERMFGAAGTAGRKRNAEGEPTIMLHVLSAMAAPASKAAGGSWRCRLTAGAVGDSATARRFAA